ncbi:MAG: hydrogenase maturation protease [Verrucomicrobia bacterium]|nr:hydrogenase maturation protease [Verrucomicrobiota bacterium]
MNTHPRVLVVGYGNRSRRDDGVGWFVIDALSALGLPGVDLVAVPQLEVELAESLAAYDAVIFVDAAVPEAPMPIKREAVQPRFQHHAVAHYLTPPDVLGLSQLLYRREPQALLFSIRGKEFDFGTELSSEAEQGGRTVVGEIAKLVTDAAGVLIPSARPS